MKLKIWPCFTAVLFILSCILAISLWKARTGLLEARKDCAELEKRVADEHSYSGQDAYYFYTPIDMVFAAELRRPNAELSMSAIRGYEKMYHDIWKGLYDSLLEYQRAKCRTEVDKENCRRFAEYTDATMDSLQPFIINCGFDNFNEEEGSDKNSWGNSTWYWLATLRGMVYKNAFLFMWNGHEAEFHFPTETEVMDFIRTRQEGQ